MKALVLIILMSAVVSPPGWAIDKDGLRVDVQESVIDRRDGGHSDMRQINRDVALKLMMSNIGFDDLEAGTVKYTAIVESWSLSESGNYIRYSGQAEIPALLRQKGHEVKLGEIPITGHMHGTSRRHVDDLAAWKLEFTLGAKNIVITSKSSFDQMDKKASPAPKR